MTTPTLPERIPLTGVVAAARAASISAFATISALLTHTAVTACLLALALLTCGGNGLAAPTPSLGTSDDPAIDTSSDLTASQVVIVVADKLAMEDFTDFPDALKGVIDRISGGAIGLMNVRTAAAANSANGYLSLAVGSRAAAGQWAGRALMTDENQMGEAADRAYQTLTGQRPEGAIVHLGIGELLRSGALQSGSSGPLGSILEREGRTVAVFGNSDVLGERRRYAALLGMNSDGVISAGDVGQGVLVEDPAFPGGERTDYSGLAERLVKLQGVDVVIVDVGDLARLEALESLLSPGRATALREGALQRLAAFLDELLDAFEGEPGEEPPGAGRRLLYLISPSPSTMLGRAGTLITPVLRWEISPDEQLAPGNDRAALLTSATTRRDGIVTNGDFLPSILDDLGLAPAPGAAGRAWRAVAHPDPFAALINRYAEIKSVHQQRLPVIQPYFLTLLALFFLGTILIFLTGLGLIRQTGRWASGWRFVTTGFLTAPAALLLLSFFPPRPLALTWTLVFGLSLALTVLVARMGHRRATGPAGLIGALTAGLIIVDIALGAPLMQRSLLGYDPVAGSRYYGIGNEYMGVLLGATLVVCALILDTAKGKGAPSAGLSGEAASSGTVYWLPALVFGGITLLLIHPRLGINVGGAISAACTGIVATLFVLRRPITLRSAFAWGGGVALLVVAVAFLDSLLMRDQASHLGQVVQTVGDGGADPLWALFGRKVAVNLRLIRLTVWSRVVFVAFAFLIAAVFTPNWFQRGLARRFPGLVEMTKAGVIGGFVALVANDSGVVAASTLMLWPVLTVLSVLPEVAQTSRDLP